MKYGVSPAFLLSLFGEQFTPKDVVSAISLIRQLGFDCFQSEIVFADKITLWENGGAKAVSQTAEENELTMSQLVAHFMMEAFKDRESLFSDEGVSEITRVFQIADMMRFQGQVTIPMGPFRAIECLKEEEKQQCHVRLVEKMRVIMEIACHFGNPVAIEVQPRALISGVSEILGFLEEVGSGLGYNYDTGHAWASGAVDTAQFPLVLTDRLMGTHLCDNDGIVNLSLCPGEGTIDWATVMKNLVVSGYQGSIDLEIFTDAERVKEKYSAGKAYLDGLLSSIMPRTY
ncbi:MAG: sugar phosphate isomerase/epimerase [Roseburia sp.]|nr:sugar phosphate isomerase/epimerase [Roseburia sp.]